MGAAYGGNVLPLYDDGSGHIALIHTEWVTLPSGLLVAKPTAAQGYPLVQSPKGPVATAFDAVTATGTANPINTQNYPAVLVQVLVSGASPSVTLTVSGSPTQTGTYVLEDDPNATKTVTANTNYIVRNVSNWVQCAITAITGTATVSVTPLTAAAVPVAELKGSLAPKQSGIAVTNISQALDLAQGNIFTFTITPPSGQLWKAIAAYLNLPYPSGGTANQYISVSSAGVRVMYFIQNSAALVVNALGVIGGVSGTQSAPGSAMGWAISELRATASQPATIAIANFSAVTNSTTQTIQIAWEVEAIDDIT